MNVISDSVLIASLPVLAALLMLAALSNPGPEGILQVAMPHLSKVQRGLLFALGAVLLLITVVVRPEDSVIVAVEVAAGLLLLWALSRGPITVANLGPVPELHAAPARGLIGVTGAVLLFGFLWVPLFQPKPSPLLDLTASRVRLRHRRPERGRLEPAP